MTEIPKDDSMRHHLCTSNSMAIVLENSGFNYKKCLFNVDRGPEQKRKCWGYKVVVHVGFEG